MYMHSIDEALDFDGNLALHCNLIRFIFYEKKCSFLKINLDKEVHVSDRTHF